MNLRRKYFFPIDNNCYYDYIYMKEIDNNTNSHHLIRHKIKNKKYQMKLWKQNEYIKKILGNNEYLKGENIFFPIDNNCYYMIMFT
jgi:hypothetical protein